MTTSSPPSKYRMVALDLDGTLLQPNHQLSQPTIEYLRYLHSKGFIVSIATGRSAACTFDQVSDLKFEFPSKLHSYIGIPVICSNGARGAHIQTISEQDYKSFQEKSTSNNVDEEVVLHTSHHVQKDHLHLHNLFHDTLLDSVTRKVISLSLEMPHFLQYYVGLDIYAAPKTPDHKDFVKRYGKLTGVTQKICDVDFQAAMEQGLPSKILIICGEEAVDDVYAKVFQSLKGEAHVVRGSPPWFVEVLNPNVCKGNGLKKMSKHLNIRPEEIIAFGDGDNDLEFLDFAGKGIAMKNARDNVKAAADEITEWTNAEDGVIRTLMKLEREDLLQFASP